MAPVVELWISSGAQAETQADACDTSPAVREKRSDPVQVNAEAFPESILRARLWKRQDTYDSSHPKAQRLLGWNQTTPASGASNSQPNIYWVPFMYKVFWGLEEGVPGTLWWISFSLCRSLCQSTPLWLHRLREGGRPTGRFLWIVSLLGDPSAVQLKRGKDWKVDFEFGHYNYLTLRLSEPWFSHLYNGHNNFFLLPQRVSVWFTWDGVSGSTS